MTAVARSICLSENEILALLRGELAADAQNGARSHIDSCGACQDVLACLVDISASGVSRRGADRSGPTRALQTGQAIGRYRVLEPIGAGAMGIVYLAEDPHLHRTVAVKVHRNQDAAGSERLLREARAIARLSHPNVIVVHEVGTFEENVFMAMEFVDGGSLTSWLTERERSTEEIIEVFVQAGRGLAVAHTAGLVHRDFKPDNVLVGKDGRVRVVDFGLAREDMLASIEASVDVLARTHPGSENLTRTGTVVGTPAYMAPEQYAGKRADGRSDQFAFAVALFEALYGQRPFLGDTFALLARAVSSGLVVVPRTSRRIPKPIAQALLRSLRSAPERRFDSMDELLRALTRSERKTTSIALGAVAAIALASGAFFALNRSAQPTMAMQPTVTAAIAPPPPEPTVTAAPPPAQPAVTSEAKEAAPVAKPSRAKPKAAVPERPARAAASPTPAAKADAPRAPAGGAAPSDELFNSIR